MRRPNQQPAPGGFTLIELMVVLVLMGILSAMILPEMKGTFADALLRSSGRDLVNVFKLAYSRAVSLNQVQVVRVDEGSGHYQIERLVPGRSSQQEYAPLKDVSGSAGKIDPRIRVQVHKRDAVPSAEATDSQEAAPVGDRQATPASAVAFYPDGTADGAEVLLHDSAGFGLRLRINPITSRVEILQLARQ